MKPRKDILRELVLTNADALASIVMQRASELGLCDGVEISKHTWANSVDMINDALIRTLDKYGLEGLDLPVDHSTNDPLSEFATQTARIHRDRGVSLPMFMTLLKVYRAAYVKLVYKELGELPLAPACRDFVVAFFDRAEIAQCANWAELHEEERVQALEQAHRLTMEEKDRFLTLYESLATPVLLLDEQDRIELLNHAATRLMAKELRHSLKYACANDPSISHKRQDARIPLNQALPWMDKELQKACPIEEGRQDCRFDTSILIDGRERHFNIAVSNISSNLSNFVGTTVVIDDITIRVEVERQLTQERNMAAEYLDVVGSIVVAMDVSGGIMLLNKTGHKMLGYEPGELVGMNWIDLVVPIDEREELREYFFHIMSDDLSMDDENVNSIVDKDGKLHLIQWRNRLLRNEGGMPIGVLASGQDITHQREMEDALAEKEAWLRNTFVSLGEGVLILSPANIILDANPAAEPIFQMTNDELCDTPFEELHIDSEHFLEFEERAQHAFLRNEAAVFDFPMRRGDGSSFPAEFSVSRITGDDGNILGTVCALRDVSDRERRERHLRESEAKFRRIFDTIEEGFIVTDLEGTISMVNPATCRMLGYSQEDLLGQSMGILYANEGERKRLLDGIQNRGKVHGYHLAARRRDGQSIVVEANAHQVVNEDGIPIAMEGTFRDITARLEAEQMLREREKLYRAFFENNHAIMLLEDPKSGEIVDANPAASVFYGYTVHQMRAMNTAQINALSEEEIFQEMFAARNEKRSFFIFKHRLADGELRDVEVYSGPIMVRGNQLLYSVIHDVTDRMRMQREMTRMATTDALTGANNRHQFFRLAEAELKRTERYGHALSVIMLDIDYFKSINDTYGHHTGDVVLKALSDAADQALRETDIFGRLGGEEFAAILPETELDGATNVAERLRESLAALKIQDEDVEVSFTVSIGVTSATETDKNIEEILNRADEALYKAKRGGRNKVMKG
ncbi:PAS domain S-box protein [Pseudodesulfovibrio sp. zrk46]|uniref:sensor domain-containing diguanylate cyclase n=1 Tax=Pseudodesulfovibrio sp. zrk46 TaxID=2725288 RepID=UPI001448CFEE|nr:PAS domain S-box protein [Pseudodesulfovibrio sp. zrk46]QJB56241.1 PAS domain S-box protein [Pseudodesulfovibrio sp. zrk46]